MLVPSALRHQLPLKRALEYALAEALGPKRSRIGLLLGGTQHRVPALKLAHNFKLLFKGR
jgi:hypothetical protein